MSQLNIKKAPIYTHEGAKACYINAEQQLRRSVMACLLWEDQFYEDGESIADRIANTIPKVLAEIVAQIAIEARNKMKLRHMPLFIASEMAKHAGYKQHISSVLSEIIQRPDELSELLAIYWKQKRCPIASQIKKGLAKAFTKFDEYQLAKYNRDNAIKLRDVLFLCHAKPKDQEQEILWKKLVDGNLQTPDTWEVSLSAQDGEDKKAKWERLLKENRLGAMALLRNLRNMKEAQISEELIFKRLAEMKTDRILPFRFVAAAKHASQWENQIEKAMLKCITGQKKMMDKTILLIDVSGSMDQQLSAKSDMNRIDAACGLAIILREICDQVEIFSFSNNICQIPPRHGFALRDAITQSQQHDGTYLGAAILHISQMSFKRIIVITDEQSHDTIPALLNTHAYMINVASYKNGVGYGPWIHIDGWSEAIIDYIRAIESTQ